MTAPRIPRVWSNTRPVVYLHSDSLTTCQASETGCQGACEQGRRCPDDPPMTSDDLLCALGLVAVIAAPFVGVWLWRLL